VQVVCNKPSNLTTKGWLKKVNTIRLVRRAIKCILNINDVDLDLNHVTTLIYMPMDTTTPSYPKHVSLLAICYVVKPPYFINNDLNISWVTSSAMSPLNTFSKFNNIGTFLKPPIMYACTLHQDWLSIGYFIITNNDVLSHLDNNFRGLHDNAMHCFYHLQICGIILVLARHVLHLQEIK
jgi:hypothetical protein